MRSVHGELVENLLTETKQLLNKIAATSACPSGQAVGTSSLDVDQQTRVFKHPWDDCVVDWDPAVDTGLRHRRNVLNMPRISIMPTSVPPFDCES